MTRRPSYRQAMSAVEDAPPTYIDPSLVRAGSSEYDRRAATLDAAATAFLKRAGKAGRTHDRNYTSKDRSRATAGTEVVLLPNQTLVRGGGQRMVGVRMHGTGR
jgi:hypothetical protein